MTATIINPPLRTIRLYGEAGTRFGRVHRLALVTNTPAEAVHALCSQIAGLRAYLMQSRDRGVGFAVFAGRRNIEQRELRHPVGDNDIRIAPVLAGNKRGGVLNVILGAVLIIAGYVLSPYTGGASMALVPIGWSMVIGGVIQMLSPMPKGLSSRDGPANTPSYSFNGPINTEAQGHPVPYFAGGPMWIGSAVISAGITVKDNSRAALPPPGGSGSLGHGGDLYRTRTVAP